MYAYFSSNPCYTICSSATKCLYTNFFYHFYVQSNNITVCYITSFHKWTYQVQLGVFKDFMQSF